MYFMLGGSCCHNMIPRKQIFTEWILFCYSLIGRVGRKAVVICVSICKNIYRHNLNEIVVDFYVLQLWLCGTCPQWLLHRRQDLVAFMKNVLNFDDIKLVQLLCQCFLCNCFISYFTPAIWFMYVVPLFQPSRLYTVILECWHVACRT